MKTLILSCVICLLLSKACASEPVTGPTNLSQNGVVLRQADANTSVTPAPVFRPPALIRLPCTCQTGVCGCCTGYILDRFSQKACLNFTIEPEDFSFTAVMSLNGRVLYRNTFSGKNPDPVCISIPRLEFIKLCIKFSNIYIESRNIHLCIDMTANWDQITLLKWSFDCIRMGASGFAVVRPEEDGGIPVNPIDVIDQTDEDYDDSARTGNFPVRKNIINNTSLKNIFILDSRLRSLAMKTPNKYLIEVKSLPNGHYLITEKTKKP